MNLTSLVKKNVFVIIVFVIFIALFLLVWTERCGVLGRLFCYCTYLQSSPTGGSSGSFSPYCHMDRLFLVFIVLPIILIVVYKVLTKRGDWKTSVSNAKARDTKLKGKKERTDHDLVAYGVSRDES